MHIPKLIIRQNPCHVVNGLRFFRGIYRRLLCPGRLRRDIDVCRKNNQPLKIILGSGKSAYKGWIATDIYTLDITKPTDWEKYFTPSSIDALMSEHVLEHVSIEDNRIAMQLALKYLKAGGRFRIAVPDGNRRDDEYIKNVAPPIDDHKVLFTLKSLTEMLCEVGFTVQPLEYFDENEEFHAFSWNSEDGHISRSVRYDHQESFKRGKVFYTSLIVDALKPTH